MSYQLLCQCGRTLTGARQRRHQVLPCPGCGRSLFVLPRSVFAPAAEAGSSRRWWRGPLAAGAGCFLVLLLSFAIIVPRLIPRRDDAREQPFDLKEKIELGRRQLGQGKFRQARRTLSEAVARRDDALSPAENRELNQLHRQADLLSRLLTVDLDEVLRLARHARDPEEWSLQFSEDLRGRSVIFDGPVGRDERGRIALLAYVVESDDESARVALEDLDELRDLPLEDEPRLVFGARLAACEREPGGGWVIRLQRDSGVLLTNLEAVVAADVKAPDKGLKPALERQKKWLDERAVVAPAPP